MKKLMLILVTLFFIQQVNGQNFRTKASGNYSNPAIWEVDYGVGFIATAFAPINVQSNYIQISSFDTVLLDVNVMLNNSNVNQASDFTVSADAVLVFENGHHIYAETSINADDNSELNIYLNATIEVKQVGDFINFSVVANALSTGGFEDFKHSNVSIPDAINVRYVNAGNVFTNDLQLEYNVLYLFNTTFTCDDAGANVHNFASWSNSIVNINEPMTFISFYQMYYSTMNLNSSLTYQCSSNFINGSSTFNAGADAELHYISNNGGNSIPSFGTLKKLEVNISNGQYLSLISDLHISAPQGLILTKGDLLTHAPNKIILESDMPVYSSAQSTVFGNVSIKVETASPSSYEFINFPIGYGHISKPLRVNLSTDGINSCYLTASVYDSIPVGTANFVTLSGAMSDHFYKLKVEQPNPLINSNSISNIANLELEPTGILPALNQLSKIGFSVDNSALSYEGISSSVASPFITSIQLSNAQIADLGSADGSYIGFAKNVLTPGEYCIGPSASYTPPVGSPSYVNGNNPYGNITSALTDLHSKGCNGPITFVIQNNYTGYTAPPANIFEASPISISYQADVSRPVVFTNRTDNVMPILITNTVNSGLGVIEFNGAQYVSIKGNVNNVCGNYGIAIRNNASPSINYDPGYSNCMVVKNDSKNIEVSGIQFEVADRGIHFNNNIGTVGSDSINISCNKFIVRSNLLNTNVNPIGIAFGNNGIASPVPTSNDINIQYNNFEGMARGIYFNDGISGNVSILNNHFYRPFNNNPGPQFISFIEGTKHAFFTIDGNYFGGSTSHCGGAKMNTNNAQYFINLVSSGGVTSTSLKSFFTNNHVENMLIGTTTANMITLTNAWDVTDNVLGNPNVTQDISANTTLFTFNGISVATPINANTYDYVCNIKNNSISNIFCPTAVQGNFNAIVSAGTTAVIESNTFENIESGGNNFWLISTSNITPLINQLSSFKYNVAENIKQTNTLVNSGAGIFKVENVTGSATRWSCIGNRIGSLTNVNDIVFNTTTVTPFKINIGTKATQIDSNTIANVSLTNPLANDDHCMLFINAQEISSCAFNTIFNIDSKSKLIIPEGSLNTNNAGSLTGININDNNSSASSIHHNTIYNLTNSNTTSQSDGLGVVGIFYVGNGLSNLQHAMYNNQIYGLNNLSASIGTKPFIIGAYIQSGGLRMFNNMIGLSNGVNTNSVNILGVKKLTSNKPFSFYHNSISLTGLSNIGCLSYCLQKYANSNGTDTMKNNIFYTIRSGAGLNYALSNENATQAQWGISDYNAFFNGQPNQMGKWTTSTMPFATWQTTSNTEAHSFIKNIKWVDVENDLHLNPNTNCAISNAGTPIASITNDLDDELRSTSMPDIGADEFDYIEPTATSTAINAFICEGETINLQATFNSLLPASFYVWSGPNSFSSVLPNPAISNAQSIDQGNYTVTVSDFYGCGASSSVAIYVAPLIDWYLDADGDGYYFGNPISACSSPGQYYTNITLGNNDCNDNNASIHPNATEVCGNNMDDDCDAQIDEGCNSPTNLTIKLFTQGFYIGSNTLNSVLLNQGESLSSLICDSVSVELKLNNPPFLTSDFYLTGALSTSGEVNFTLPSWLHDGSQGVVSYWIVVKHRNSIETWSNDTVPFTINTTYDFTTSSSQAFGSNQVEVEPNIWAFYSGDINQDGIIDNGDYTPWETDANNFASGYLSTDLNGDGSVGNEDYIFWETNSNGFVGAVKP